MRNGGANTENDTISPDEAIQEARPAQPAASSEVQRREITFAAFAEEYLGLQDQTRSDIINKERNIRLHLLPYFGGLPLNAITRREVDAFRASFRVTSSGGRRRPKTINNVLGTLRAILNVAHGYELVDRFPAFADEKDPKRDPEFLDFDEANAFLAAAPEEWRTLLLFALATGLRRGEYIELRWGDLDLDRKVVRVSRAVRKRGGVFTPKSTKGSRPRSVPLDLDPDVVPAVHQHRALQGSPRADDLVFPGEDGGYLRDHCYYRVVVATGERAGLAKRVRPHILRHTFASHCSMTGVPPRLIQEWMGHESFSTTERYAHLNPAIGTEFIARVAARRAQGRTPVRGSQQPPQQPLNSPQQPLGV
ncbi:MAG: tyrosine-type recombinase/integrase [Nannocystaceae bacterium]